MGWDWILDTQAKEACTPTCLSELSRGAPGNSNQRNCPGPHGLFLFPFFMYVCDVHVCTHVFCMHVRGACMYVHRHVEARGCQESSPITLPHYVRRQGLSQTGSSQIQLVFFASLFPLGTESQEGIMPNWHLSTCIFAGGGDGIIPERKSLDF